MPVIDSRHTQIWSMTSCRTSFSPRSKGSRRLRASRRCGRGWSPSRYKVEDIYRQRLRAALALDLDSTEDQPASNDIPLDEQIDKARAGAKTRRVLVRMPERYAFILLWRYWEPRSARDVAPAIGTTEKGVERLLARARAKLKELWLKE
jgi:RNA polymerase sigma factor (sigma-70 family)